MESPEEGYANYNLLAVSKTSGVLITRGYLTLNEANSYRETYENRDYDVKIGRAWSFGEGDYNDWDVRETWVVGTTVASVGVLDKRGPLESA